MSTATAFRHDFDQTSLREYDIRGVVGRKRCTPQTRSPSAAAFGTDSGPRTGGQDGCGRL